MITIIHLPLILTCCFIAFSIHRFWACVRQMGFTKEINARAPLMVHRDVFAAALVLTPVMIAVADWSSLTLPGHSTPISSTLSVWISIGLLVASLFTLRDSLERVAGSWAGTRESVLRTIAALRIIDDLAFIKAPGLAERSHSQAEHLPHQNRQDRYDHGVGK
jgi:hypothetical protein